MGFMTSKLKGTCRMMLPPLTTKVLGVVLADTLAEAEPAIEMNEIWAQKEESNF